MNRREFIKGAALGVGAGTLGAMGIYSYSPMRRAFLKDAQRGSTDIGMCKAIRITNISETSWFDNGVLMQDVTSAGGLLVDQYTFNWPPFGNGKGVGKGSYAEGIKHIKHLLPKKIKENGLQEKDVTLDDAALEKVIREYTREAGLRNLERELSSICRKLARRKAEGKKGPFRVSTADVEKLLGAPRFIEDEKEKKLMPGMALGLAWTPAGGEVLTVEATVMKGKGGLTLTGQLGDVMKESAQAALSYIRSRAEELGVDPSFVSEYDIHVHVPAGATPKDGPSAGVTLTTALISALNGHRVRADLCMTGEITLQGRVLPVGGIKEKILAGVARGLKHVVIPWQNTKDLEDVPKELLKRITVHPVHHYDELLPLVFEGKNGKGGASGAGQAGDKGGKSKAAAGKKDVVAARTAKPAAPARRRKDKTGDERPTAEAGA